MDNRPLQENEFWEQIDQALFVSATPAKLELEKTLRPPVEMVIRPTFVCDPVIEIRPSKGQLDDLVMEIKARVKRKEMTLAKAITKRDAEDLSIYLVDQGISVTFIHSDLNTHERSDALRALHSGDVAMLTALLVSTCYEKDWIFLRSLWLPFSMLIQRDSFDQKQLCFKRSGGRLEI